MQIEINPGKPLHEIQEEFQRAFPWLKIEFFRKPHGKGAPSAKKDRLDNQLTVAEAGETDSVSQIVIDGDHTVAQLEKDFQEKFNLSAQVMRKSGEVWILTTTTDRWTLRRQNETGHEDSKL